MATIVLAPITVALPLTVGEDSVVDFEAKAAVDLLEAEDLSSVSQITVRIENPPGDGNVYQYTATVLDATAGTFQVTLTGAQHPQAGVGRGRVLFDGVTVPLSRFEIEWLDAF